MLKTTSAGPKALCIRKKGRRKEGGVSPLVKKKKLGDLLDWGGCVGGGGKNAIDYWGKSKG